MTVRVATLTANQRRLAAQAVRATELRLSALADTAVPAKEAAQVTTPAVALSPEILAAAIQQVLTGLGAAPAPVMTPVAPAPPVVAAPVASPKPSAQQKWDAYAEDKVVTKVLANGVPVNKHGMFLKRAEAIDPQGLLAKPARIATPAQPVANVAAPASAASVGITLAQLEQFLKAMGLNLPTSALAPAAAPVAAAPAPVVAAPVAAPALRQDGSWLRCGLCDDAYWGAHRGAEEVTAKYAKHLAKKHAG